MKHVKGLLRSIVPLIAVAALLGCDARLPRPWEPTIPHKSSVGCEYVQLRIAHPDPPAQSYKQLGEVEL